MWRCFYFVFFQTATIAWPLIRQRPISTTITKERLALLRAKSSLNILRSTLGQRKSEFRAQKLIEGLWVLIWNEFWERRRYCAPVWGKQCICKGILILSLTTTLLHNCFLYLYNYSNLICWYWRKLVRPLDCFKLHLKALKQCATYCLIELSFKLILLTIKITYYNCLALKKWRKWRYMYVWMKTILSLRLKFYVWNFLSYANMCCCYRNRYVYDKNYYLFNLLRFFLHSIFHISIFAHILI